MAPKKVSLSYGDKLHNTKLKFQYQGMMYRVSQRGDSFEIDCKKAGNGGYFKPIGTRSTLELAKAALSLHLNVVLP